VRGKVDGICAYLFRISFEFSSEPFVSLADLGVDFHLSGRPFTDLANLDVKLSLVSGPVASLMDLNVNLSLVWQTFSRFSKPLADLADFLPV